MGFRAQCGEIPSERLFPMRSAWGMPPGHAGCRARGNRQGCALALPGGQCSARGGNPLDPSPPRRRTPPMRNPQGFAMVTGWWRKLSCRYFIVRPRPSAGRPAEARRRRQPTAPENASSTTARARYTTIVGKRAYFTRRFSLLRVFVFLRAPRAEAVEKRKDAKVARNMNSSISEMN